MSVPLDEFSFRPCTPADVDAAIPLIHSSGAREYNYVFSLEHAEQSLDFLRHAFLLKKGQFSHAQMTVLVSKGKTVGIGGVATKKMQLGFLWYAVIAIFKFYGFFKGFKVLLRGLKIETILKPPRAQVGLIYNLAIAPHLHSQGWGRRLVQQLISRIRALDLPLAGLDVSEQNSRARALYERIGFVHSLENPGDLKNKFGAVCTHHYLEMKLDD